MGLTWHRGITIRVRRRVVQCKRSRATTNSTNNLEDKNPLPQHLELVRPLGNGAMAEVFLTRDPGLKRLVALKVLRPELSQDTLCRKRFEREAQTAARLSHKNIPTIFSVGRLENGRPFIEMQYIQGRDLRAFLKSQGTLSLNKGLDLLQQIAAALNTAHQSQVVHRDIKPENILVDEQDHVWLCDFGVASIVESGGEALTRLTRAGERFGDPRYMSPEQIRGETLTPQSDIYSFAVLGYEVLTGQGPFDSGEIRDVASAHLRRPPPKLSAMKSDCPEWLSELLHRCLAKDANHRPSTTDVLETLKKPNSSQTTNSDESTLSRFLDELKTRKVYQAAAAYAAAVFLLLQVADLTLPAFAAGGLYNALVIGSLLGFPIIVVLAWIFDWRQGRLVKTQGGTEAKSQDRLLMQVGLGLCVIASLALAIWLITK